MKVALTVLLALHGALHLLGFAKGFGLAELARLQRPIGPAMGLFWLAAAVGLWVSAGLVALSSPHWWVAALVALPLSQLAIAASWSDAKAGTAVNALLLVPLVLAGLDARPGGLRAQYRQEAARARGSPQPPRAVTEAELAGLPPLLQKYLRRVGVVGKPHVHDVRARFRGQLRASPTAGWMEIHGEQHNFFDPPARLFLAEGRQYGLPVLAFHRFVGADATMRVRVASLVDVVDARGPEMNQSETVTIFNDMCLLAPASLLGAAVTWQQTGPRTLRGTFTHAGNTVHAELTFDDAGDLVGFRSEDRYQSADGKSYRLLPWSTPVRDYRDFHGVRLGGGGEAVWLQPEGELVYARIELEDIQYNVGSLPEAELQARGR